MYHYILPWVCCVALPCLFVCLTLLASFFSSLIITCTCLCVSSAQQYLKLRSNAISALKQSGPHPYPHKFHVTMSLVDFIERYQALGDGEHHTDVVSVAGWDMYM